MNSGARSLFTAADNHILHEMHETPEWVGLAPTVFMVGGFLIALFMYVIAPKCRPISPRGPGDSTGSSQQMVFRRAVRHPLRPAGVLARPLLLEGRRRRHHRRLRPRRHCRARARRRRLASRLQSGYIYHYAFAMLLGVVALITLVVMLGGVQLMFGFGILSGLTFLPLVGVALILAVKDDNEGAQKHDPLDRAQDHARDAALSFYAWWQFDPGVAGFQFVEQKNWFGAGITYHMGVDGISMLFVVLTAFLMPFCIAATWDSIQNRVQEYMIAFLVLETLMIGVFCALDCRAVLRVLRRRPDPDVPDHRHLGRQAARLCQLQVLPLHAARLGADAARHHGDVCADRHHRHRHAAHHPFRPGMQTWLWLAFFATFAVKMPMWPVHTWLPDAHVEAPTAGSVILAGILLKMGGYGSCASRCPCSRPRRIFRAAGLHPVHRRDHLHLAGGAGAGGHEEADRLFLGGAYGFRHHGHLHADPSGRAGGGLPDAEPRRGVGRAVPLRRRGL